MSMLIAPRSLPLASSQVALPALGVYLKLHPYLRDIRTVGGKRGARARRHVDVTVSGRWAEGMSRREGIGLWERPPPPPPPPEGGL
jgi:hypothetical protein